MRKTYKNNSKLKRNKTIKKLMFGGTIRNVPITSILLTDPICTAIKSLKSNFKPTGFKKDPGNHGFRLHKLTQNQRLNEPITVKIIKKDPEYFSIIDGRHRFAKLVARGNSIIKVNIMNT